MKIAYSQLIDDLFFGVQLTDDQQKLFRLMKHAPELLQVCKVWLELESETHFELDGHEGENCNYCRTGGVVSEIERGEFDESLS